MFRCRIPWRFSVDSHRNLVAPQSKWNNFYCRNGKFDASQTRTTSTDHYYMGENRGKLIIMSLQEKIVNALSLGDRSRASTLLSDLGHGGHSLKADDFVLILDYCSKLPDPLFVMETWRIMMEKEIRVNYHCCLLGVQALCKGGYLEEALNLMKILREDHDIYPTLRMFNSLLGACARMQSLDYAHRCLELMESQRIGKNEETYLALLELAVWQQNLSAVQEFWREYIKYCNLSVSALQKFIRSFARLGDFKSAYVTLQQMVVLTFNRSFFINNTDYQKLYSSRLDSPIPSNNELCLNKKMDRGENFAPLTMNSNEIGMQMNTTKQYTTRDARFKKVKVLGIDMLDKMKRLPLQDILRWSFNDVIRACVKAKNYELSEQLMMQMQNLGLKLSSFTYDSFIRPLVSEKGYTAGLEVLKTMEEEKLKPYDSTFATVSAGCSKVLELDLAEMLLDQTPKIKHAYAFNAFLEACDRLDEPKRAVHMLAKMKQLGLQPDIRTYELLFSLFGNVNAPYEEGNILSQIDVAKRINAIEMDMLKNGIQHSHCSMMNLLKALGTEGMIRELIQYLYVAEDQLCRSNMHLGTLIYNVVLHALVKAKESHMAVEIFKKMRSDGFQPSVATYTIMVDCCSITRCYRSSYALISLMLRDGFSPQAVTFTVLVKNLLDFEDFTEAFNLLDQASAEGIVPDVILYNTVLRKACLKGKIDLMEFIVERMHREKIKPDPSTCSNVFSAYVELGFFNTSMEALQVLSMRMLSEEGEISQEKITEYEDNFIYSEDSETESRMMQFFETCEENIVVALLNLRWCATIGSSISWLPAQSAWASRLEDNYGTGTGH